MRWNRTLWAALLAAALLAPLAAAQGRLQNVYLVYGGDPSTSIVVNWHNNGRTNPGSVRYDTVPRGGDPEAYAMRAESATAEIPDLPMRRTLHAAALTGLAPDTVYYFVCGSEETGYSEERSFRTIPEDDSPLRFISGGDLGATPLARQLLEESARHDPAFFALGGDIAYVDGRLAGYRIWDRWFENYDETMRTSDGHMIPILAAIGNHETNRLPTGIPEIKAPFYTYYFGRQQADGLPYFHRRFGANVIFFVLDTGHLVPHAGAQTAWLAENLAAHQDVRYKFAMYHVPLYPSHRSYDGGGSRAGRIHWQPYFDAYGMTTCFEHHDHTLKRSKLLRHGKEDPDGVLYIGDGSMGIGARTVDDELRWYLETALPLSHYWVVDVDNDGIAYRAYDENGELLDEYAHSPN